MVVTLTNIIAIMVVTAVIWRRGRDRQVWSVPLARSLTISGMAILGLVALIYLVFGVGEMSGGIEGGIGHLFELLPVVILLILAWVRPGEVGMVILVCGVMSALSYFLAFLSAGPGANFSMISTALLITSLPQIVAGALIFAAGIIAHKRTGMQARV